MVQYSLLSERVISTTLMGTRVSPAVTRALGLYARLRRIPYPGTDRDILRASALRHRLLRFLETCSDRDYADYYRGVQVHRQEV